MADDLETHRQGCEQCQAASNLRNACDWAKQYHEKEVVTAHKAWYQSQNLKLPMPLADK